MVVGMGLEEAGAGIGYRAVVGMVWMAEEEALTVVERAGVGAVGAGI